MSPSIRNSDLQYSADTSIIISTGGTEIEVAGCLENLCFFREPISMPPFEGDLIIKVDEEVFTTHIFFPNGISPSSLEAQFSVA